MSYSHMGKPHTTIGANAFHFWVRNGSQVGPNRYGRQANSLIRKTDVKFYLHIQCSCIESIKTPWVLYG